MNAESGKAENTAATKVANSAPERATKKPRGPYKKWRKSGEKENTAVVVTDEGEILYFARSDAKAKHPIEHGPYRYEISALRVAHAERFGIDPCLADDICRTSEDFGRSRVSVEDKDELQIQWLKFAERWTDDQRIEFNRWVGGIEKGQSSIAPSFVAALPHFSQALTPEPAPAKETPLAVDPANGAELAAIQSKPEKSSEIIPPRTFLYCASCQIVMVGAPPDAVAHLDCEDADRGWIDAAGEPVGQVDEAEPTQKTPRLPTPGDDSIASQPEPSYRSIARGGPGSAPPSDLRGKMHIPGPVPFRREDVAQRHDDAFSALSSLPSESSIPRSETRALNGNAGSRAKSSEPCSVVGVLQSSARRGTKTTTSATVGNDSVFAPVQKHVLQMVESLVGTGTSVQCDRGPIDVSVFSGKGLNGNSVVGALICFAMEAQLPMEARTLLHGFERVWWMESGTRGRRVADLFVEGCRRSEVGSFGHAAEVGGFGLPVRAIGDLAELLSQREPTDPLSPSEQTQILPIVLAFVAGAIVEDERWERRGGTSPSQAWFEDRAYRLLGLMARSLGWRP